MTREELFGKALIKHHLISNHIENEFKNVPKKQHHILKNIQNKADQDIVDLNNAHGGGFLDWLKSLFGSSSKKEVLPYNGHGSWEKFREATIKNSRDTNNMLATLGFHRRPY